MKRALLVVALAAGLAPPAGAKAIFVTPYQPTFGDMIQAWIIKTELTQRGQREGSEFFFVPSSAITTSQCRRAIYYRSPTDSVQCDLVGHIGFGRGRHSIYGGFSDLYFPDELSTLAKTNGVGWTALKPQIFFGRVGSSKSWNDAVYCSLGCATNSPITRAASRDTTHSAYQVGTTRVWKTSNQTLQLMGTPPAGSHVRQIIDYAASRAQGMCCDWDSIFTRAPNDTALMWDFCPMTPGTVVNGGPAARIICVNPGGQGGDDLTGDTALYAMALAHGDSLSGGKVFERRVAEATAQQSAEIMFGYNTGAESFAGSGGLQGPRLASIATMKAQADSIARLKCRPTVLVEPESLTANNWQDAVWVRIPDAHFAPSGQAGKASSKAFGNASATHVMDLFGISRARAAFGDNSGIGADTSLHAGFVNVRKKLLAKWPKEYVESVLSPMGFLWQPASLATMTLDSLMAAMPQASYTHLVSASSNGVTTPPSYVPRKIWARYGFSPGVAGSAATSGNRGGSPLIVVNTNAASSIGSDRWANGLNSISVANDYSQRCVDSALLGKSSVNFNFGEPTGIVNFNARCSVCMVTATAMGAGDVPVGVPGMHAFRVLKWASMRYDAINSMMWPANAPLVEWVYTGELRR